MQRDEHGHVGQPADNGEQNAEYFHPERACEVKGEEDLCDSEAAA